mmetsp:Transcript_5486/g.14881  ORF Transcript_5486/g.14881 Transcript_5486/m.14881 type:complete len:241 (+) Transcript_5486:374-1096(+)
MGDVPVPAQCHSIQDVADDQCAETRSQNDRQHEELDSVKQDEDGKEGVAMNIKGVEPFHALPDVIGRSFRGEMAVGDLATDGGNEEAGAQPIEEYGVEEEAEAFQYGRLEADAVGYAGDDEEDALQGDESRVIAGPVVLGAFPVVAGLVDDVRSGAQEGLHLIQRRLDVHLAHVQETAEVLRGAAGAVGGVVVVVADGDAGVAQASQRLRTGWHRQSVSCHCVCHLVLIDVLNVVLARVR